MNPNRRPRFDSIYSGPWPYALELGIGIRMSGIPFHPMPPENELREIFNGYGCPPELSYRIACDLIARGERTTTVLPGINFNELALDLKAIGIQLAIVAPVDHGQKFSTELIP